VTRAAKRERTDDQWSVGSIVLRVVMLLGLLTLAGGMLYLRTFPPSATVMSDSMEPKIAVGDIVLFKATGGATPSIGDIVEVKVPQEYQEKFQYPSAIIHRVVAVNDDGTVKTKGDNLPSPDPFDSKISSIRREVVFTIPLAGRALSFLFSPFGLLWIAIGLLVFVVMPFYDVMKERAELHHLEVASLAELQAKVERVAAPPPFASLITDPTVRVPGGVAVIVDEPVVVAADPEVKDTLHDLVSAVGEYGYHLKSHTEILKSMSAASQDLARVVVDLQHTVATPEPPIVKPARGPMPTRIELLPPPPASTAARRFAEVRRDAEALLEHLHGEP
jgi:signal peptidase